MTSRPRLSRCILAGVFACFSDCSAARELCASLKSANRGWARIFPPVVPIAAFCRVSVECRVIRVERLHLPGRELDTAEAAVRHLGTNQPPRRVVVHDRRDADFVRCFRLVEAMLGVAEIGLVLLDRLALVVEDRLAARDPAQWADSAACCRDRARPAPSSRGRCRLHRNTRPRAGSSFAGQRVEPTCVSRWIAQEAAGCASHVTLPSAPATPPR